MKMSLRLNILFCYVKVGLSVELRYLGGEIRPMLGDETSGYISTSWPESMNPICPLYGTDVPPIYLTTGGN